jgi:hypothetical protein
MAYQAMYPGVGFGLTLISGCKPVSDQQAYDQYKRKLLRKMRKRETLAEIRSGSISTTVFSRASGSSALCPSI